MKTAALAYSKHRNAFGLAGIRVQNKRIHVELARHWTREQRSRISNDIAYLRSKIDWGKTITDQLVGEDLIQNLKNAGVDVGVIVTQKDMKDPKGIHKVKKMDIIEMTHFMLTLFQEHRILFPPEPSPRLQELEKQVSMFSEHRTESGGLAYFAPGDELDDLSKALIIACFAVRPYIDGDEQEHIIGGIDDPRDNFILNALRQNQDVTYEDVENEQIY